MKEHKRVVRPWWAAVIALGIQTNLSFGDVPGPEIPWNDITDAQLTPDGHWLAYLLVTRGSGFLSAAPATTVLRRTQGSLEHRYDGASWALGRRNLQISGTGRWVGFNVTNSSGTGAELVEPERGIPRVFAGATLMTFINGRDERVLLRYENAGRPDGSYRLEVQSLTAAGERPLKLEGVRGYALNRKQTLLVWEDSAGLHVITFPSGKVVDLGPSAGAPVRGDMVGSMSWRDDDRGFFFQWAVPGLEENTSAPAANLVVWHWRDVFPQAAAPLYYASLAERRVYSLSDPQVPDVIPHGLGQFVLGFNGQSFGPANPPAPSRAAQARNYYLVELASGRRRLILPDLKVVTWPNLSVEPTLSPRGDFILYQDLDGDYVSYEIANGVRRNLTRGLPTRFYFEENAPHMLRQPRSRESGGGPVLQGWAADGRTVLLSDYYDVWALALNGKDARNLTGNGRKDEIIYELTDFSAGNSPGGVIDLRRPVFFLAFDVKSARTDLLQWNPLSQTLQRLRSEEGNLRCLQAQRAPMAVCSVESSIRYHDYERVNNQWRSVERLTDANPQQRRYDWLPSARYLTYRTTHGDELHGVLYLPIGYQQGRRYPLIVRIYEDWPGSIYDYVTPQDPLRFPWLAEGYAVLLPDIRPRIDAAGPAALEAVLAATQAAIATGTVDGTRMGLTGHSYGGYETYFIVSKTDVFRAAVPEAGMTDLVSFYGQLSGERESNWRMAEFQQPYLSGPWWDHWNAYVQNSPLFNIQSLHTPLLLIHGDHDGTVAFAQAVELFNSLRRLGDRPAVLLQYKDEDHVFSKASQSDIDTRMHQFFDHFLKGAPAPQWWLRD